MSAQNFLSFLPKSMLLERRREIFWALGIFFLVYAWFICNFLYGNHDWRMILSSVAGDAKTFQSRPFAFVPLQLCQGFYLPVLTPFFSLLAYFTAGVLFLMLLPASRDLRGSSFILPLLLFALSPTLLGRLYYEGAGIGENVALCSFLLGASFCLHDKERKSFLMAVALFIFSLGVNQCIINTFWTLLLILLISTLTTERKANFFPYCGAFSVALVIYLILIKFVLPTTPNYNNQIAGAEAFLNNILPQLKASVAYFWQTQPPMNRLFKVLFSLICLGGFVCLLARLQDARERGLFSGRSLPGMGFALLLLLIAALVLTNNVSAYVSGWDGANTLKLRMDYYSMPFILSFCATVALQMPGLLGRLFKVGAVLLVILSMGSDVRALQVWKITIDDDILYANRMLARIEANPEFDAGRPWRILALGRRPVFGERFWRGYDHYSLELQRPLDLGDYNFHCVFNYISPNLKITYFRGDRAKLCATQREFLDSAPAWPSPDSLKVVGGEGLILVVLDRAVAKRYCAR